MDDSQSSDIFSQSSMNLHNSANIDEQGYEFLLTKIKGASCINVSDKRKLSEHFNLLLEDCSSCIYRSFDFIIPLLDSTVQIDKICGYIENAITLLQILSNYIKKLIENIAIECHTMKTFPTSTGNIILLVFTHCKDSECIYGSHLRSVEKVLKDLFRSCHELQLTYLMALGKLFLFDLTDKEEQEILLEALEVNLKIGEVAQALDVKTMAEQWKAYTMICEKYSNFIVDKNIYNNCTKLLISTVESNIKIALEAAEEDKIVKRSLKVASFSLKILLKIVSIFKDSMNVEYDCIIYLINYISLCYCNYYEITSKKSTEFCQLLAAHLSVTTEAFITQLVNNEKFINMIVSVDVKENNDTMVLQNILVSLLIIRTVVKMNDVSSKIKYLLIERIFSFLPYCHTWFNKDIKFKCIQKQVFGLYESLLLHTLALAATMTRTEYCDLEKHLYEAVLGIDYYSAVFSSNLWMLLCRIGDPQLQINMLINLIHIYQKLENHPLFYTSPQRINLNYTLETLFENLKYPEKLEIFKQFNIQESKNIGIWFALKISSLPENIEMSAEKFIVEKLSKCFEESNQNEHEIKNLIKYMNLASTCLYNMCNPKLEDLIVQFWCKACPHCSNIELSRNINADSIMYFKYIESLARLTECYMQNFENSTNLNKVQYVISKILLAKNTELTQLLFKIFCKLFMCHREYEDLDTDELLNILKAYNEEHDLQKHLFSTIITNNDINDLITPLINDLSLIEINNNLMEYKSQLQNQIQMGNELKSVSKLKFIHKCIIESKMKSEKNIKTKSNFDIDIDSLFDVEIEPVNKKAKFDTSVEDLILNLENDVALLSQAKENILSNEHKIRIENVCDHLRNILS